MSKKQGKTSSSTFEKLSRPKLDVAPFISSTYNMLQNKDAFDDVFDNTPADGNNDNSKYVRWSESGTAILISDELGFSTHILPKYFKHKNISSFIRQLNIYGFNKTKQDPQFKEFSNPHFQKDYPELLSNIHRRTNRNKAGKAAKLQKILGAQKGLNEEDKAMFKSLVSEVKYMKSQANSVTTRLRQIERENAKLKLQNEQMMKQSQSIMQAEGRMRKMLQFMYMMKKQQEKNLLTGGGSDSNNSRGKVKMLKNTPSFIVAPQDSPRVVGRTNSFTFNEMLGRSSSRIVDSMFGEEEEKEIEPIIRPEYIRANSTDSEILHTFFGDSPKSSGVNTKNYDNESNLNRKSRGLSRGNSFVTNSSILANDESSAILGKRTKVLSPSPTNGLFSSPPPVVNSSSKKKRKVSNNDINSNNSSTSNNNNDIDDDIANLASNTSSYYTRLGSFEESLGRSYGNTDIDSMFTTPLFDEDVLNGEVAEVVD